MAIFGPFPVARAQVAHDPRFAAALVYVQELLQPGSEAHRRILEVEIGTTQRIELPGGAYVLQQVYMTRLRPESYFESHRRNIDIQVVVEGLEVIEVEDISRLPVAVEYDAERELIKYGDVPTASRLLMRTGDAAIFFPTDGHMPTLRAAAQPVLVRKSVVKVPVGPT
jgi:YhcH/YjgK/YiaL family protein